MKYNLKFQKWKRVHNLDFYGDLKHLYTILSKCKHKYRQETMTFGPPHTHTHTHTHKWLSAHHTHTKWPQLPPQVDTHLPYTSHVILNLLSLPRSSPILYPKPSASASFQEIWCVNKTIQPKMLPMTIMVGKDGVMKKT